MKTERINTQFERIWSVAVVAAGLVLGLGCFSSAMAQSAISVSPVGWTWGEATTGTSRLVRTDSGLSANIHAVDLPAGHVMTLWFVVFNNPAACSTSPCGPPDLFNDDPDGPLGDFLWGAGTIVGGSGKANMGGHLSVGDISRSGLIEIDMPDNAVGLIDPRGAEVHLLVHSHGPMVPGQTLKSQLNSFLGGCEFFQGNEFGIAESFDDVPTEIGGCSTIQGSLHE